MKKAVLFLFVLATAAAPAPASDGLPFRVIVNPSVTGRAIPRTVLAQVFLGAVPRWGNGDTIQALDLSSTSVVRQAFSEHVLGMSIDAVKHHWLRKIATGVRPPLSKATDEDVIAFVASQRGGVGYVSAAATLPPTVHEIAVQ